MTTIVDLWKGPYESEVTCQCGWETFSVDYMTLQAKAHWHLMEAHSRMYRRHRDSLIQEW